jgi:alanyl-tRNA synthetase
MLTVDILKDKFLAFFKKNGHFIIDPAKLIREKDTVFTIAGMQQFWWYFLGIEQPPHKNLTSAQPCLRLSGKHNDLDEVGQTTRHLTNFIMLGHFSFGKLSKMQAIDLAWRFLESLGINSKYLYVTIHHTDPETRQIWREYLPNEKIITVYTDDNFWSAGESGPCGPCTEIFFDQKKRNPKNMTPEILQDCIHRGVDLLEIWNLVFMQFNKQKDGKLEPLEKLCIDTGMGLERLASVVQGHFDVFKTDHLAYFVEKFKVLGVNEDQAKLLADHSRAIVLLKDEGLKPSAMGAGGVLRLLVRKCLNICSNFNEVLQIDFIEAEERLRQENLKKNEKLLASDERITEEKLVYFYQTHGLAREKVFEKVKTHNLNPEIVKKLIEDHKNKSKKLQINFQAATEVLCYEQMQNSSKIVGLFDDSGAKKDEVCGDFFLVAKESCFYGQGGGQAGDIGEIITENGLKIRVKDCTRQMVNSSEYFLIHHCFSEDRVKIGVKIDLIVDQESRGGKTRGHSATHLLSEQIMRDHGRKIMGSSVKEDRFTLDYSGERFSKEQLDVMFKKIRLAIKQGIAQDMVIKRCGDEKHALGTEEKHPDAMVRVVRFGEFSSQLCGGTHVKNTADILAMELLSDKSMGRGIRRLSCLTGRKALTLRKSEKSSSVAGKSLKFNTLLQEQRGNIHLLVCESPKINTLRKLAKKNTGSTLGMAVNGSRIRGFLQYPTEEIIEILENLGCSGRLNGSSYDFGHRDIDYRLVVDKIPEK